MTLLLQYTDCRTVYYPRNMDSCNGFVGNIWMQGSGIPTTKPVQTEDNTIELIGGIQEGKTQLYK